jgi:hypothetical protein
VAAELADASLFNCRDGPLVEAEGDAILYDGVVAYGAGPPSHFRWTLLGPGEGYPVRMTRRTHAGWSREEEHGTGAWPRRKLASLLPGA